jgi:hypothetical protein
MSDLFENAEAPEPAKTAVQQLFVDEAGTPTLFHESGKVIVDTFGCSRFFIIGKLEVKNPPALASKLIELRQQMLADPMFIGTESFKPERKRTAVAFHAKDDLPEVRFRVFDLLRQFGNQLRFYAVVCDKFKLLESEVAKRASQPGYRFNENSVYDSLLRELFGKLHPLADRYEVCVAKRGNNPRNEAIKTALAEAEADFEKKFGFQRNQPDAWTVTVQTSKNNPCLQAADYFLWALQRFYEVKRNANTKKPQLDSRTGLAIREDRFLNAVWPQVGEIHDLHFGPSHGTFFGQINDIHFGPSHGEIFTEKNRLKLAERFPPPS